MAGWGGRKVTRLRQQLAAELPCVCWRCGHTITPDDDWNIGHIIDRAIAPDLAWDPGNWRIEHGHCNKRAGAIAGNKRRPHRRRPTPTSRDW